MNPPAENATAAVLEMRGVSVGAMRSASTIVAQEVNWTVRPGEFWVVGAPQHSGKSDFLMTTGGIMSPHAGEYFFRGERMPIFEESRMKHRLKLGFVFDGGQLLNQLSVAENIALPLRYHAELPPEEVMVRVRELLEATELLPWADRAPINVGRSWQQRAGLARALALRPEVLLLDSPLTGLDARHATWWLQFLEQLWHGHPLLDGKGLTVVATADDLRPWRQLANRVACLTGKRFVVLGDWSAVDASSESVVAELVRE